jgi:hypothetical protein
VGVGDLGALATNYGTQLAAGPSLGGDNSSAASPLALVAGGGATGSVVPEPATLGLLGLGSLNLLSRRRRRREA